MAETLGAVMRLQLLPLFLVAVATNLVTATYGQTLQLTPGEMLRGSPLGQPPNTKSEAVSQPAAASEPAKIAQGYLYVEPYQVRFEALMDARRFLHWLNPLREAPAELDVAAQKAAEESAHAQVLDWCRINVNGSRIEGSFIGISAIKGRPGATLPLAEGESIPIDEAMFGLMWEFPTPPGPEDIIMEWRGFSENIPILPVRVFFGKSSEVLEASRLLPRISWKAEGRLPRPAPLAKVPELQVTAPFMVPLASIIWAASGLLFLLFVRIHERHIPGGYLPFTATWILGAILTFRLLNIPIGGGVDIPEIQDKKAAETVLTPLLRNVYRAFDHRSESEIYDVLARSVDGELLRQLYLETIQALTLEGREGTRVTIHEFSADVSTVKPSPGGPGFVADCQWTALGNVGHWGHTHTRVNRYTATVTIHPVENAWKITGLQVREARRL